MLHELLHLTRPLFVLDTETTGTDPHSDRIIELGFQQWGPEGMIKEWRSLLNPGVPIPAATTAVHHITDEDVKDAYTFDQLAPNLAKGLVDCDFAGQHIRFDLSILQASMSRAQVPWHYAGARILDSFRLEAIAIPRNLSALYEKYTGRKHEAAHGVLPDIKASAEVLIGQLTVHHTLPRDLDQLHAAQWPGYIDTEGRFKLIDGVATISFGKWRGKPMRDVPRGYWAWISGPKSDFSEEIKKIARAAISGTFPE